MSKMKNQNAVELLLAAANIYKNASYQGHSSHWDSTMQGGAGCPECKRAAKLRAQADTIVNEVKNGLEQHT